MAIFAYCLLLLSVTVALASLGHVWLHGLAHALGARDLSLAGRGKKLFWVLVILLLGPLGAVSYWMLACPRSA